MSCNKENDTSATDTAPPAGQRVTVLPGYRAQNKDMKTV